MNRTILAALTAACLTGPVAANAAHFSFVTLDDPADPTFNQLLGINDAGIISGYFGSGALVGHPNKGYTIAPPYSALNFVSDNLPGSIQTQATGINAANATTGFWSDTNLGSGDNNFGFIRMTRKNGFQWLSVNDPLVAGPSLASPSLVNQALGINASSNAVGFYIDADGNSHGYAYFVPTGTFTPIDIPHATAVAATGINDNNLICGFYVNGAGTTIGFVKPEKHGVLISFRVPHSNTTQLLGINNSGQTVGFYVDASGNTHGLYYNPSIGWQRVDDPKGVGFTVVNGLNNSNQLVGFYMDAAGNTHGMVVTVTP